MELNIFAIIFYLLLIDAVVANLAAWSITQRTWHHYFGRLAQSFPIAKGWTTYYLILVLFIGYLLLINGQLG